MSPTSLALLVGTIIVRHSAAVLSVPQFTEIFFSRVVVSKKVKLSMLHAFGTLVANQLFSITISEVSEPVL